MCGSLHVEFHDLPGCKCDCNKLSTGDIIDGTALMMHIAPNMCGCVAQVVGQACKGIGHVAVGFTKCIDSHIEVEHAQRHGSALSMAEPDTHTPTIETNMDVLVAKVTKAVKIAPSIVCYCGLPVAQGAHTR